MERNSFKRHMDEDLQLIEETLRQSLPQEQIFQKTIFQAMEYSLMGGGKRIRPMMVLEAYRLFGGIQEDVVRPFIAAIEMVHTYSLIHDDLPAMDDDDYRRGRKTTHIVYGEDMGILAGDALLNFAFETASQGLNQPDHVMASVRAIQILSSKAGVYGMVGGQVVDVERTGQPLTEDVLEFIYRLKTGALIEASLMMGAALAGATEQQIQTMEQIGYNVGMAFQIQDDILDLVSNAEELGKPVHSDEKNEKTTYVTLHGMDQSVKAVEAYSMTAMSLLKGLGVTNEFLSALIETLIYRKK